jgi:hypothetical protein
VLSPAFSAAIFLITFPISDDVNIAESGNGIDFSIKGFATYRTLSLAARCGVGLRRGIIICIHGGKFRPTLSAMCAVLRQLTATGFTIIDKRRDNAEIYTLRAWRTCRVGCLLSEYSGFQSLPFYFRHGNIRTFCIHAVELNYNFPCFSHWQTPQ